MRHRIPITDEDERKSERKLVSGSARNACDRLYAATAAADQPEIARAVADLDAAVGYTVQIAGTNVTRWPSRVCALVGDAAFHHARWPRPGEELGNADDRAAKEARERTAMTKAPSAE